jgi:signal transduction histidine kinase
MKPARRPSIALPIFLLVIVSVATAALVLFAITFNGPPPRPAPMRLETLAQALAHKAPLPFARPRMVQTETTAPPAPPPGTHVGTTAVTLLAQMLRSDPRTVRVYTAEPQYGVFELRGPFIVAWHSGDRWRTIRTALPPRLTSWHKVTLMAMAALLALLGIPAWWIARAISRPIARLAAAADSARMGARATIPRGGPREVDALAEALDAMQSRLLHQAEGRTVMLAAIAHDMGTPLSRIAFRVEQLPEAERARAAADIDEVRAMLASVLRLARDERIDPVRERIELGSLLDSLVEDLASAGSPVTLAPGPRAVVRGDSAALRRLFGNLIDNGVRYGGAVRIGWTLDGPRAVVRIDDDGPGFDADPARLFEPFVRGDPSRNRATGGTGLGLAIVRSVAEAHGGEVTLETRDGGGGCVRVTLPVG